MKKLFTLLPIVAVLAACGTTDPMGKRADQERERQERYVERTIDKAPKWMNELPTSKSAVYSSGTSSSGDYSMAVHKAKADAYAKICMAASGTTSQRTNIYRADSGNSSSELSEMVIRMSCKQVDVTGVEVADQKIISEGNRYRAYVLVVLPTGDANILKKAREEQRLQDSARRRAPGAFAEMDKD